MHGCFNRRLACLLALVTIGSVGAARGQQFSPGAMGEPGFIGPQGAAVQPLADASAGGDTSLAAQLADVKKQLADIKKKDDDAKAKAASAPTAVVGGMIQWDYATFSQNAQSFSQFGQVLSGDEFRRARIKVAGEAFQIMDYCIEMDFASLMPNSGINYGKAAGTDVVPMPYGNSATGTLTSLNPYAETVDFKDVFIGIHSLPMVGNVKAGHFKEPFGLEQQTSDRFTTFMERSMGDEGCLVPARQNGVMIYNWTEGERATWAFGGFKQNNYSPPDFINQGGGDSLTGRLTWLPWYDEATDGRGLLHVGVAGSYRSIGTNTSTLVEYPDGTIANINPFNISARPEAHLGPKVVGLNLNNVDDWKLYGAELAYVYGPLSFQSEVYFADVNFTNYGNDAWINAGYAYISYFLTGENRTYNKKAGCFDRVKPYENFFRVRDEDGCVQTGLGAWEIGYRYSWANLNSDAIVASNSNNTGKNGGIATDNTIGVNWYLNPYSRVMMNYILSADTPYSQAATGRGVESYLSTFETRFQIDF